MEPQQIDKTQPTARQNKGMCPPPTVAKSEMQQAWERAGLNPDKYSAAVGDAMKLFSEPLHNLLEKIAALARRDACNEIGTVDFIAQTRQLLHDNGYEVGEYD